MSDVDSGPKPWDGYKPRKHKTFKTNPPGCMIGTLYSLSGELEEIIDGHDKHSGLRTSTVSLTRKLLMGYEEAGVRVPGLIDRIREMESK